MDSTLRVSNAGLIQLERLPFLGPTAEISIAAVALDFDELADNGELTEHALTVLRTTPRIVIGHTRRSTAKFDPVASACLDACDIVLGIDEGDRRVVSSPDPASDAANLVARAQEFGQAATVLGQVLRAGESLPTLSALAMESLAYSTLLGGAEHKKWLEKRGAPRLARQFDAPAVEVAQEGRHLRVTLNRSRRRNAYSAELRDALRNALTPAVLDDSTEITVNGDGPSFCSGGDLDEFGTMPDPSTAHFIRSVEGVAPVVHALKSRISFDIHGHCVGAGIEVPAFAGTVRAARGTEIRLPEVAMGLIPGAGGTVSIPARIGRWRTCFIALSGRSIDVDTAQRWGLVDEIIDQP